MLGKKSGKKGQVSLEMLILATATIILSLVVIGHYTQIRESTTALEVAKIEALRQIDGMEGRYIIERMDYRIAGNKINLCMYTDPRVVVEPAKHLDTGIIETEIGKYTAFEPEDVTVRLNTEPCQDPV